MRALLVAACLLLTAVAIVPSASAAAPCGNAHLDGPVAVATTSDCDVIVSVKPYDCVWGGHWTVREVGPLTVRTYSCDPHPPA